MEQAECGGSNAARLRLLQDPDFAFTPSGLRLVVFDYWLLTSPPDSPSRLWPDRHSPQHSGASSLSPLRSEGAKRGRIGEMSLSARHAIFESAANGELEMPITTTPTTRPNWAIDLA